MVNTELSDVVQALQFVAAQDCPDLGQAARVMMKGYPHLRTEAWMALSAFDRQTLKRLLAPQ